MPRLPRAIEPNQPQHVITRGNNRRRLFSYPHEYLRFLAYLLVALRETGCLIHQLTMMSNHLHMVVVAPSKDALARLLKSSSQRYALYRNRSRDASGKLFESRFWSDPIDSDASLAARTAYNDANAIRAGMVDDLFDYEWSTYALHAGRPELCRIPEEIWTPSPWYSALADDHATRAARYREFIRNYLASGDKPKRHKEIEAIEALSSTRYTHRLQRPDGTSAQEPGVSWRKNNT